MTSVSWGFYSFYSQGIWKSKKTAKLEGKYLAVSYFSFVCCYYYFFWAKM